MTIHYEWDVEEVEIGEDGDIIDHHHVSSYFEALAISKTDPRDGAEFKIVLVRDNDDCHRGQRSWAYMENGNLPDYFEDAMGGETAKVPERFFKEVDKLSAT